VGNVAGGDGATEAAGSKVRKDVPAGETWIGYWAQPYRSYARSLYLQDKLEDIWQFVKGRR
jgi:UDP-3-O-[3-hydroxymyristoyl] glucosamine N-acyltransferase